MDGLEVNKACAAVLVAGIGFMLCGLVGEGLVHPTQLKQTVLKIDVPPPSTGSGAPAGPSPIEPMMAKADPAAGEATAGKVCAVCHNFQEGGAAKIGPDLYGVLGRAQAAAPGFDYSTALKAHKGQWTYDELNKWLYKPATYAPGTRMAFAGFTSDKQRADVIAYLRSLSKNPEPLPPPDATPAAAPGNPAPAAQPPGSAAPAQPTPPAAGAPAPAPAQPSPGTPPSK